MISPSFIYPQQRKVPKMPYVESPPKRVRALILGGGIHGVGVLHDLVSRGFKDVFLCEKNGLGSGTSSRSTKLIHGGLRYLKRISDFPLVSEALRERRLLLSLAPDIVHPLELYLPLLEHGGEKSWMVRAGLTLYDVLAGKQGIQRHRKLLPSQALLKAPVLDESKFPVVYSFWDAQTDDMALVHRVAASAVAHGGRINEACEVLSVQPGDDGWIAGVRQPDGGGLWRVKMPYGIKGLPEPEFRGGAEPTSYESVHAKTIHAVAFGPEVPPPPPPSFTTPAQIPQPVGSGISSYLDSL